MQEFDPNKLEIRSKAVAPDYHPGPFYFVQSSETGAIRIPCWSQDPSPLGEIMLEILQLFPEEVGILIKARLESPHEYSKSDDEWIRYHGYSHKRAVQTAFAKFRKFLLRDSTHQFMARNPDTGEYFAFDDYGILWIYSENAKFRDILTSHKFLEKFQPLIYEGSVWKFIAPDSQDQLRELVDFLMLEEVQKSEPEEPQETMQ
jgi:hypothetical protein